MATQSQHRLAVLLHADVVGSTALVRRDERVAHERIRAAFLDVARAIEAHEGAVNEIRGDALVAEFARASDAVLAALDAQRDNERRNAAFEDEIVPQLRIGIALGEVVVADDTVTGAGIVLAQRLEQLAPPGGVCISSAIREAVPDRLPVDYVALGEQAVKGFDEPVRAFTLTPRGEAPLPAPPRRRSRAASQRSPRRAMCAALVVCSLAVTAAVVWWLVVERRGFETTPSRPPSAAVEARRAPGQAGTSAPSAKSALEPTAAETRSIAVLPFANMSDDPGQEYFSDGLTEDIITDLARISGLLVIARNSSFVYKGRAVDVKTVGHELGVRYVLEGSVRKAGERVRITAQLIDAQSGMHLWAERYDRDLTDVFALQDEVTRTIVDALSVNLTADEADALARPRTVGTDAYDMLLKGNEIMARFSPEAMVEARAIYEQVVQLDPRYARAHANIAFTHAQEALFGWADDEEDAIRRGLAAAAEARRLDDRIPQLYLTLANLHGARLDWEEAAQAARRSVALEPSYADGYVMLAVALTFLGDLDEATRAITRAKRLNPHYSFIYLWVEGRVLYLQQRYGEAAAVLEDAVERNPDFDQTHIVLAATYGQLGRVEDAQWESEEVLVRQPEFSISSDVRVRGFRDPELLARYVEGLRKAGLPE